MRHRLFHAIVIVGASLPMACGGSEETTSLVDSGAADSVSGDSATIDSSTVDSGAADSSTADSPATDSAKPETSTTLDATPDVCDGGCGSSCFPCIK